MCVRTEETTFILTQNSKHSNIKMFMNLIQMDGYNPLSVDAMSYSFKEEYAEQINTLLEAFSFTPASVKSFKNKFTPGEIARIMRSQNQDWDTITELISKLVDLSEANIKATFKEGFWIDHWTYNLELIKSFKEMYPDMLEKALYKEKDYRFYVSPAYVLPRSKRYTVKEGKLVQRNGIQEIELEPSDDFKTWLVNDDNEVYKTNLMSKLWILAMVKFSVLDPNGGRLRNGSR